MKKLSMLIGLALLFALPALAADWKIGDKVQGWNSDWYDGTIVEIGSGSMAGYYKIQWDKYTTPQFVKASNIRARPAAAALTAAWPRLGRYVCLGYSGGAGQFRWYLELTRSSYQQKTPDLAPGQYNFDATAKRLFFLSGPYKANNWFGKFSVEREGKTHQIVLRDRAAEAKGLRVNEYANIVCTNSTDS